jgi:sulfur-carrier protein adenylyltransferase/sulfurtransferase
MPKVYLPTPLRPFAQGAVAVDAPGATVAEVLGALVSRHTGLRAHLFDGSGQLRAFVNVYKNDEDIRHLDREQTGLAEGDTLSIVPSIAGGSPPTPASAGLDPATLSREELQRYARHLIMPEVGAEGQAKLKAGRVLVVGAGGLGSPAALYLAAAGVGTLGLVDFDVVDPSNLHRQVLFGTSDVGRPKLEAAMARLTDVNPNVRLVPFEERLTSENALRILPDFDVVADGTDNFPTRYLVNDACVLLGKPNVYASIFRFEGQASVFGAKDGPCYRCLYAEPPPPGLVPSCAEGGVLGVLPGLLGVIQATETVKLLLGAGEPLVGRLLLVDALSMRFRELKVRRNPDCVVCGPRPTVTRLIDYEAFCGVGPGAAAGVAPSGIVPPVHGHPPELSVEELKELRDRGEKLVLVDVREPREWAISDLADSVKIPLGTLPQSLEKLSKDDEIIVYCRTGGRSGNAVAFLMEQGFEKVRNLAGGINRWAERIDKSLPRY